MTNQGPFYIYISNNPVADSNGKNGGKNSSESGSSGKKPFVAKQSKNQSFISKFVVTRLVESSLHVAEQDITNRIESYGYLQGDYAKQKHQQFVNTIAKRVANAGAVAGVALATGHPAAAVIDVAVSIVSVSETIYWNNQEGLAEARTANYNSSEIMRRGGLNSITAGSRGTED